MLLLWGIKKSLTFYMSKSPNFSDTFKSLLQYLYAHPSIKYFNISAHFPFNFPQLCIYRYLVQDIHTVVDTQFLTGQCTQYSQMHVVFSCLVVVQLLCLPCYIPNSQFKNALKIMIAVLYFQKCIRTVVRKLRHLVIQFTEYTKIIVIRWW